MRTSHTVDSLRISALADPETRSIAETIDQARHGEGSAKNTLSYPEVQWARQELQKLEAGEPSALDGVVAPDDLDRFEARFSKVEEAFSSGKGLLGLLRAPPLRLGGEVFENVFALPADVELEPMLELTRKSGYDQVVVKDAEGQRYIALGRGGRMKRADRNAEAVLACDDYRHVRVIHVEDIVNSFFEGALLIPRRLGELLDDSFRNTVDSEVKSEVDQGVRRAVDGLDKPVASSDKKKPQKLVAAGAIGLGTVGMSTFVAVVPEVAAGIAGIAALGSTYNALRGAFRKEDPFYVLNVLGVHLARADRVKLDELS